MKVYEAVDINGEIGVDKSLAVYGSDDGNLLVVASKMMFCVACYHLVFNHYHPSSTILIRHQP